MDDKSPEMEIEAKEGIIGFFDILGFKNYLKNDPNIRSKQALNIVLKLRKELPQRVKERIPHQIMDEVQWNILSDTIVLSIPYLKQTGADDDKQKMLRWMALLLSSVALMDYMFEKGLPIRGAIAWGKYFVHDSSMAGSAIIDALTLSQKLNLSAAVLCPDSEKELRRMNFELQAKFSDSICFPYLVPTKEGMKKLVVLNQWALNDFHSNNNDMRQLVAQAFWKHDKDIDEGAYEKLENTEMLLRHVNAIKRNETGDS
jgi:hypothetical protein